MLTSFTQGSNVSRSKRQRSSRLAGAKNKVDRLNYLFEAIEADKASDSENAHGIDSRGSQGEESDSARPQCADRAGVMHGEEASPPGMPVVQWHPPTLSLCAPALPPLGLIPALVGVQHFPGWGYLPVQNKLSICMMHSV